MLVSVCLRVSLKHYEGGIRRLRHIDSRSEHAASAVHTLLKILGVGRVLRSSVVVFLKLRLSLSGMRHGMRLGMIMMIRILGSMGHPTMMPFRGRRHLVLSETCASCVCLWC